MFKFVDLSGAANHRIVYEQVPKDLEHFGLDDVCIIEKGAESDIKRIFNGVEFRQMRGEFDNVSCENQEIPVNTHAKAIHVLGFSFWGDNRETFEAVYADGTSEKFGIMMLDWSHSMETLGVPAQFDYYGDKVRTAAPFLASGRLTFLAYMHQDSAPLGKDCEISKLRFPDNTFLHIVAVTLEE